MQAAVPAPVYAAGIEPAVVGEENDDGIFAEAVLLQLVKNLADAHVGIGDRVEVARPFLAGDFVVGIIWRRRDVLWSSHIGMSFLANPFDTRFLGGLAFINIVLGLGHVDLREERLFLFQVVPVPAGVHGAFLSKIQIQFARAHLALVDVRDVGGVIAGVPQQMRDRPLADWQPKAIRSMTAHVMHVGGGGLPAGHQRRPARRAHRQRGTYFRVSCALPRQTVEVRCADVLLSLAGEVEREILADDPEDIWLLGSIGLIKGDQAKPSKRNDLAKFSNW